MNKFGHRFPRFVPIYLPLRLGKFSGVLVSLALLVLGHAVNAGKPAGTVIELTKEQIPLYAGVKLSQHQITFQEVLGLANIRGYLPEYLHLVGIQPGNISVGLEISPVVQLALPEMVTRARAVLNNWK